MRRWLKNQRRRLSKKMFGLPNFTLKTALEELDPWQQTSNSCFRRLVKKLKLPPFDLPDKIHSPLELLVPLNNAG